MAIDFTLTDEQRGLQEAARTFADKHLSQVAGVIAPLATPEQRFAAIRPFYDLMVEAGFLRALIPVDCGGTAMPQVDFAIAAEELCRVDINTPTTLLATGLGLQPVIRFGTPGQRERFLRPFTGSRSCTAAWAFTEAAGGANFDASDPAAGVRTVASRDGDHWVLNGAKHYTTNGTGWDGQGADVITVLCRTDLSAPPEASLAVLVVPGGTPGVEVTGLIETVGHRATNSPKMTFTDVRVPVENMIGAPGDGLEIVRRTFNWTASLIGAACVGRMRAAFEFALDFARTQRRSGPVPIIEHQNAGYMLVDVKTRLEAARYFTWKACHHFDLTDGADEELGHMVKIFASELAVQVVYDAMRLVGIDAYTDMTPIAAILNDALAFPLYDGGNMGMRRRQLHALLSSPGYDPVASAQGRAARA